MSSQAILRQIETLKSEFIRVRQIELNNIASNKKVVDYLNKGYYVILTHDDILLDVCHSTIIHDLLNEKDEVI